MPVDVQTTTFAGLPAVRLIGSKNDHATLMLRGGQLVSWVNPQGEEMLHVRPFGDAVANLLPADGPQHGGTVVFPALQEAANSSPHSTSHDSPGAESTSPTMAWVLHDAWFHLGVPNVSLRLKSSAQTKAVWPHDFDCFLHVAIHSPGLSMALEVVNTGTQNLEFTTASHPYLRVENSDHALLLSMPQPRAGMVVARPTDRIAFTDAAVNELVCLEKDTPARRFIALLPGAHWSAAQTLYWVPQWARSQVNA